MTASIISGVAFVVAAAGAGVTLAATAIAVASVGKRQKDKV